MLRSSLPFFRTAASLVVLGAIGVGFMLVMPPEPSSRASGLASASASYSAVPPSVFCGSPVSTWNAYAHYPPLTSHRGKINGITAVYGTAELAMTLDDGRNVAVQVSAVMSEVALHAYAQKLPVTFATHNASCGVIKAEWIKI